VGVWLSMGLLCGALCWALQGWLPAVWALAGSMIAVLHIGIVSYWTESYWGGTCAAIGGALLIGALLRLIERQRVSVALAFASGLAILANTRPFEGLVFAVVCAGWLGFEWIRERVAIRVVLRSVILPMALLLLPVAAGMAYYNLRLTGDALELPYVVHDRQYALLEPVLWEVIAELKAGQPDRVIDVEFKLIEPVNCDRPRIAQLFSNLLSNALSYGCADQPVRVRAVSEGETFELFVANAGEPIPVAALDHLFHPFYHSAVQHNREGLGLGLYIANEIARAHGGTLGFESTRDETSFTFRMPSI